MIAFIVKTWVLWWMFAIVIAVRWFHLLSIATKLESPDASGSVEEESEYVVSWQLLRHAQAVSLAHIERAF